MTGILDKTILIGLGLEKRIKDALNEMVSALVGGRGRFGGKEVISLKEGNKEGNVTKWRAVDKITISRVVEVIR